MSELDSKALEARGSVTRDGEPDEITIFPEYVERKLSWIDGLDAHEGPISGQNLNDLIEIARQFAKGYREHAAILTHVIADRERIRGERNTEASLRTALPAPATQEVEELREIKPLVWNERLGVVGIFDANSAVGNYRVDDAFQTPSTTGMILVLPRWRSPFDSSPHECISLEVAFAAAQADYEARIRSALAPAAPQLHEDTARLDWLEMRHVEVIPPFSRWHDFVASPQNDENGFGPSDLRAQIDRARAAEKDGQ